MEQIMACRVCLATDVKLYEMCKYELKTAYENLSGLNMPHSDTLEHVCSYCGTMLNNFTRFREKCARSQHVLEMLRKEHILVTTCHIKKVNRHSHSLPLPYTVQHIQHYDTTVTVKFELDENGHIKSDNDDSYDFSNVEVKNNFNYKDANIECYNYSGNDRNDSDEEPLSKKVRKKRKKSKIKLSKHSSNKVDVKTENGHVFPADQDFPINVRGSPINDQDFPINEQDFNDHEFSINDQDFPINNQGSRINDQDYPITDQGSGMHNQDFPISDQHVKINDQDFLITDQGVINDQNFTNEQNLQSDDKKTSQVLDFEMEHKLVILSKEEQIEEVLARKASSNYLNSVYRCDSCFKGFMTESTYKNHMARHDPICGPVACPVCATRWPDARALRAHTLISHERRYICRVCGHTSKSSHKAKEHARWHAGVTFPCHCGRTFTRSTSYLTHVRLRHASHACAACGQSFIGENGLNMHKKKAHAAKGEVVHECGGCRVQFRSPAALQRHCSISGGACDDTLLVCVQCGDHLASIQLLKEHADMHLKTDSLWACSQCSRTFANERSLAVHVQRSHARARPHAPRHCVCEVCGYKCVSASSLVNHQRVHSGEKPFACEHCHKRFSVAQRLQIHVRTHTGERPFQCVRCPKAFKHKAALNRHDRVHTGVKPYSCPQCGKSFSQSNSMKQHCAGVHMKTYKYSRRSKQ